MSKTMQYVFRYYFHNSCHNSFWIGLFLIENIDQSIKFQKFWILNKSRTNFSDVFFFE
jgi:hypothetical protein